MKNLLLGVCMLFTMVLSAQTMSGNWMVGGDAGFQSYKPDYPGAKSQTTIYLNPQVGYFVMDNLAVGARVGYQNISDDNSSLGVGPFVRYYFAELGEMNKLLGEVSYTFNSNTPSGGSAVSGSTLGIQAGLAHFFNSHVAMEALLGYRSDSGDLGKGSGFGLNVGFQIHLGGE